MLSTRNFENERTERLRFLSVVQGGTIGIPGKSSEIIRLKKENAALRNALNESAESFLSVQELHFAMKDKAKDKENILEKEKTREDFEQKIDAYKSQISLLESQLRNLQNTLKGLTAENKQIRRNQNELLNRSGKIEELREEIKLKEREMNRCVSVESFIQEENIRQKISSVCTQLEEAVYTSNEPSLLQGILDTLQSAMVTESSRHGSQKKPGIFDRYASKGSSLNDLLDSLTFNPNSLVKFYDKPEDDSVLRDDVSKSSKESATKRLDRYIADF